MATASRTLRQRAYEQVKKVIFMALYLWLVFGLFTVYKSAVLAEHHINFAYHGFALINALALAKVMLVAEDLHLGERFSEAPLIYPTLFKSGLFTLVLACFKILEDTAVGFYHKQSFHQSTEEIGGGSLKGILTLTLILFVVLMPFVGLGELQRVLGKEKLAQIFFRQRRLEN